MASRRTFVDWLHNWGIVLGGALLFLVVVVLVWCRALASQDGQTIILALTAVVLLWYTAETMRMRREAEERAERDREPRIHFDVEQFPGGVTSSQVRFFFIFRNESSNPGLARVRVRLRTNLGTVLSPTKGYDGQQTWEVIPFFGIRGWFDLTEPMNAAKQAANAPADPSGEMQLNVQVDVYWPDRRHLVTLNREYHLHVTTPPVNVTFFPEVATSLSALKAPKELP
jgi:hypothetical protein